MLLMNLKPESGPILRSGLEGLTCLGKGRTLWVDNEWIFLFLWTIPLTIWWWHIWEKYVFLINTSGVKSVFCEVTMTLAFKHQIQTAHLWVQVNVCTKFEEIPSRRSLRYCIDENGTDNPTSHLYVCAIRCFKCGFIRGLLGLSRSIS